MKKIHFIAIGGAAMHNLALAMNEIPWYHVTGSDDEIFEPSRSRLAAAGLLPAREGWYPERITPDLDAVILGMHATKDNPELIRAQQLGLRIYSFPEYLYEQTLTKTRVVVGGSHGKTTTTAMILHALKLNGLEADFMVGAQIEGFDTMVRLSPSSRIAVFEGDEYLTSPIDHRPKFHIYRPHLAVLTGIAWDHINVFPTFEIYKKQFSDFVDLMEAQGRLIYCSDDKNLCDIVEHLRRDLIAFPYSTPQYEVVDGVTYIVSRGERYAMQVFGEHNLQNMNAARLVCGQLGISEKNFYTAMQSFHGANNRLQKIAQNADSVAFKDFAHSPSKLKATVKAVREQYPAKHLIACMELHTFSSLTADFLPQYKGCMDEADEAYVYFNPEVIKHKRLQPITTEEVRQAFGRKDLKVFTDSAELVGTLHMLDYHNAALLMMTSGNFSGVDIQALAKELLEGAK